MLTFSAKEWTDRGVVSASAQFFISLLDEAVDNGVDYSFRPRVCNLPLLLQEVVHLAEVVEHFENAKHHLHHIIDEAVASVGADPIVSAAFPWVLAEVKRLAEFKDRPADAAQRARVIEGYLKEYPAALRHHLHLQLLAPDAKQKEQLETYTHLWISELTRHGYTAAYLRYLRKLLVNPHAGTFADRLKLFFRLLNYETREWHCYIGVRYKYFAENLQTLAGHYRVVDDAEVPFGLVEHLGSSAKRPDAIILQLSQSALDPFAVAEQALLDLRAGTDLLRMYLAPNEMRPKFSVAVVAESGEVDALRLSTDVFHASDFVPLLRGKGSAEKRLKALQLFKAEDRERILSAVQFLQISRYAETDETKLTTAWMGLETLARGEGGSIVERLAEAVAPCSATEAFSRSVANLAYRIDVHLYGIATRQDGQHRNVFIRPRIQMTAPRLMKLLLGDGDNNKLKDLYSEVSSNPALAYRLFRLRQHKLRNGESIKHWLEIHKRRVDWQIRRVSRLRNDIVHRGVWDVRYRPIVNHLQSYLHQLIVSVVDDLTIHPLWSVSDSFAHRRATFELLKTTATSSSPNNLYRALLDPNHLTRARVT